MRNVSDGAFRWLGISIIIQIKRQAQDPGFPVPPVQAPRLHGREARDPMLRCPREVLVGCGRFWAHRGRSGGLWAAGGQSYCEGSHDERHALLRPRRAHEGADRPMGPAAEWECVLEAAALAAAWRQA